MLQLVTDLRRTKSNAIDELRWQLRARDDESDRAQAVADGLRSNLLAALEREKNAGISGFIGEYPGIRRGHTRACLARSPWSCACGADAHNARMRQLRGG